MINMYVNLKKHGVYKNIIIILIAGVEKNGDSKILNKNIIQLRRR